MRGYYKTMKNEKKYIVIGSRLRDVRLALHPEMKISKYAEMLKVNYTQYLNWESGLNRLQPHQAEVLCDKLGLTMDFIYRGIEAALPQSTAKALSSIPRESAQTISKESSDNSAI